MNNYIVLPKNTAIELQTIIRRLIAKEENDERKEELKKVLTDLNGDINYTITCGIDY